MNSDKIVDLQQVRKRIDSTHLVNRILAYSPDDKDWQQAVEEGSIEELQRAYDRCPNKELWGVVELKKRIDERLNPDQPA